MTTKITTQIKGPIEDIIASYESASNVRCIGYSTREGWITLEFKEIEPEPEVAMPLFCDIIGTCEGCGETTLVNIIGYCEFCMDDFGE